MVKTIERFDRLEGQVLPQEPLVVYGKNLVRGPRAVGAFDPKTNMTTATDIEMYTESNGWYIVFRLKFLKFKVKWQNPETFDIEKKKCFPVVLVQRRKPLTFSRPQLFKYVTWFPV